MTDQQTVGERLKEMLALKVEIDDLNAKLSKLKSLKAKMEEDMILAMDADEVTRAAVHGGYCSIIESDVASVEDWAQFQEWMRETNTIYLLERRVNNKTYRELLEERGGEGIPGVHTFTKRSIRLRAE